MSRASGNFVSAARQILAARPGEGTSAKDVAERAVRAWEKLAQHLGRLLGSAGVETMWKRSLVLATAEVPWLSSAATLREAMEQQAPEAAAEGFIAVLSMFVGLLERLVGEGLADRLLVEVWPAIFSKETP
jgi:hypothetical protein